MSDQFWLTKAQIKRIEPVFPRSVAFRDRRVVTGIVHVIRNGLRWRWQRGMPVKARAAAYPAIRNTIFP